MEFSNAVDAIKSTLVTVYGIPSNLVKTLIQGTAIRPHGAVALCKALADPSSRFLLTVDMETGGYNPKLCSKLGMGHKVFQVGAALTLWDKHRTVLALCSAGAYNPETDDVDMAPPTRKWYQEDERAKLNLSKLKMATDITHSGNAEEARRDAANTIHSFLYGWQTHLSEKIPKGILIRWISDNPAFDPHLLSDFLRTNGFGELAELPTMPVKDKKSGKVQQGYSFIHDSHTLQYAAAIRINSDLTHFGMQSEVPVWSGLGTWLNTRVKFPPRSIGGTDDKEKHNASIDAATMAFDYMDAHDVLEGNYDLKPPSDWHK